jgi:uncharacterized protein (TIGR03083 family)
MSDPDAWLGALRRCHDRMEALVGGLNAEELRDPSFCTEWTVAQVLSHLGSQAEIFSLFLDAGLTGGNPPSQDAMGPIWDRWNAREPEAQAAESLLANEALITRLEGLDAEAIAAFHLDLFGMDIDATGLVRMRLAEYAVHAWDVAVSRDPDARVAPDAVELLVDGLPAMAGRVGRPAADPATIAVATVDPIRRFVLTTGGVNLEPMGTESGAGPVDGSVELAAEVLLRLVYGRLLESDTMRTEGISPADLQAVFPGV